MPEPRHPQPDSLSKTQRQVRSVQIVSECISLAVAVFTAIVLARAVGGHLDRSLHAWSVFSVYVSLSLVAGGAIWYRVRAVPHMSGSKAENLPMEMLTVAIVCPLLTAMLLGRGLSSGLLALLWILTGMNAALTRWWIHRPVRLLPPTAIQHPAPPPRVELRETVGETPAVEPAMPDDEAFSQRWTRREGELGDELEGTLRIHFGPGQRAATADIPIVPAMASIPDVDCEPLRPGDSDVQVIVRGVHTYGVRLELQRPAERTDAEEIEVAVLIHAEPRGEM